MQRVLVTGGAGFIGSHVVDALLARGCEVMAFDNLYPQVHPKSPAWPEYRLPDGRLWVERTPEEGFHPWFGDVRDQNAVFSALLTFQPDTVIHLAALVGVGQSNEKIANYVSANVTGTAILLNCLADYNALVDDRAEAEAELAKPVEVVPQVTGQDEDGEPIVESQSEAEARYEAWKIETEVRLEQLPTSKVGRVFVAGSMSSYGEGVYVDSVGVFQSRVSAQAAGAHVEMAPRGVREDDDLLPASVYASTKAEQERLALIVGKVRDLDVRVGRFFNVYGERQALGNPYTGVGAIFASRALAGLAPRVYEDGEQSRDFIHVSDLVSGILTILDAGEAGEVYNVGTGHATTIGWLASAIAKRLDAPEPEITGQVRAGDVRHCFADASKLRALGWEPEVSPEDGVEFLCEWVKRQEASETNLDAAHEDLLRSGLLTGGDV